MTEKVTEKMATAPVDSTELRVLDPIDRNSEILFSLFMVLTFTGTLSVASAGHDEVRQMLIAAIGCNIAWGFVDAVMYILRNIIARGRRSRMIRAVRGEVRPGKAHQLIADEIGALSQGLGPADFERLRQWVVAQPVTENENARVGRITRLDLRGALAVFLLVFASTFPVVLPFIFIDDAATAKRLSALIAISMMFVCGYEWGRYAGLKPWRAGLVMVLLGLVTELIIIALGG